MNINELKTVASDEEKSRMLSLGLLDQISQEVGNMATVLDRIQNLLELNLAASCLNKQQAGDFHSRKLAVELDSFRERFIEQLKSLS